MEKLVEDDDDEDDALVGGWLLRMPRLAPPFAIVGASAALFTLFAVQADTSPIVATLTGGFTGALVGVTLRRWKRLHDPLLARDGLFLRVAVLVLPAGAFVGGVIGASAWGAEAIPLFAGGGAAAGVAFLPSCLAVVNAARRAARARLGSLVAATDRRTAHATLLAALAFAAAIQAPALALAVYHPAFSPIVQGGLSILACALATVAIAYLWRRDRKAREELDAIAREAEWLEQAEEVASQKREGIVPAAVDLGLGPERWTPASVCTYRSMTQKEVVLRGSVKEAASALEDALTRRRRALALAAAAFVVALLSFVNGAMHMR